MTNSPPEKRWDHLSSRTGSDGFILITLALLLIPIMIFSALAIDVSSWYSRATELQRSADAAALAGVVWAPTYSQSDTAAVATLAHNGITDGVGHMTVTKTPSGNLAYKVCVTDNSVKQFFGVVVTSPTSLKRCATAQFNKPLQLGSPLNYFGGNSSVKSTNNVGGSNGVQTIPTDKSPGMWAAIEGFSNAHGNGDAYSTTGAEHRNTGYWYSVDIPTGFTASSVSIQAFDLTSNCDLGCRTKLGDQSGPPTQLVVYKAGALKFDLGAATPITGCDTGRVTSSALYNVRWKVVCDISSPAPAVGDRYYVNVLSNDATHTSGGGYNGYALRAVAGTYPLSCLNVWPAADDRCYNGDGSPATMQPAMSGYGDMEMYNNVPQATPTVFFLANVTPEYASHTLVIDLFDPGDGAPASWVTVMAPSNKNQVAGDPLADSLCSVTSRAYGTNQPYSNVSLSSGTYANTCTVQTSSGGVNAYQDRWLRFKINLPNDYGQSAGSMPCKDDGTVNPVTQAGSCWWHIKYFTQGGSLDDYTTWSAHIEGDPVRLTN